MKTVLTCYNSFYFEEARVKYNHLVSSLKHLVPVIEVFSVSIFSRVKLTFNPFFPMHPFFTPENIRKPCFQGVEKGCIENKWVNTEYDLSGRESTIIFKHFPSQKIVFNGTYLK